MTQQAIRLYESPAEDSYAELIYDDVALSCSTAHLHVGAAAPPLVSSFVINGQTFAQSFPPGTDTEITLPITLTVSLGTGRGGAPSVAFQGFDSVFFGHAP
jgi:hypothetical protein